MGNFIEQEKSKITLCFIRLKKFVSVSLKTFELYIYITFVLFELVCHCSGREGIGSFICESLEALVYWKEEINPCISNLIQFASISFKPFEFNISITLVLFELHVIILEARVTFKWILL